MVADPLCGFSKGLEIAQYSVLNHFRPEKGCFGALAIPVYSPDAIEDVMDIKVVVFHKGIAS